MKQYAKLSLSEKDFAQTMEAFMIAFSDWSDEGKMPPSFEDAMQKTMAQMGMEQSLDDVFANIDMMVKAFKGQQLPGRSGAKYPRLMEELN